MAVWFLIVHSSFTMLFTGQNADVYVLNVSCHRCAEQKEQKLNTVLPAGSKRRAKYAAGESLIIYGAGRSRSVTKAQLSVSSHLSARCAARVQERLRHSEV